MMADNTNVNMTEGQRQSKDTLLDFSAGNTSVPKRQASTSSDSEKFSPTRFDLTALKNVDMMAEKCNDRQSRDYPPNFNVENPSVPVREASISDDIEVFCVSPESTTMPVTEDSTLDDSSFKCWCHEMFKRNQRPEICKARLNKSSERNSMSSINSFDSGYDSKRCTHIFSISEYDE